MKEYALQDSICIMFLKWQKFGKGALPTWLLGAWTVRRGGSLAW